MTINLRNLVSKLSPAARGALEAAAGLCLSRTHYQIEVEHFLIKLLEGGDNDAARIFRHFEIDTSKAIRELTAAIESFKTGNPRTPAFSPDLIRVVGEAWTLGSINYEAREVRSGFCILGIFKDERSLAQLVKGFPQWHRIREETLTIEFGPIVAGSPEGTSAANRADPVGEPSPVKRGFIEQYTIDLTGLARAGKIDPVLGRDSEIRQMIDILMRRRQNNPILTGEPGVGKTAVVEGFALRVVNKDVPDELAKVSVHSLDLTLLQAGAGVQGEFENRLKGLIQEVKASPKPIVLFIDEAHTLVGAGGREGQGDAANILKPALARGELRTIAATTWSEYKKYFERDAALTRRFQVVKVEEPAEPQCLLMLRALSHSLEKHHSVRILDEALGAAVKLSTRYLPGRQLPDKAVSVLDTACARVAVMQKSTPGAVADIERRIEDLDIEGNLLAREIAAGAKGLDKRLADVCEARDSAGKELEILKERWESERSLALALRDCRLALESLPPDHADRPAKLAEREALTSQLAALQGDTPLIRVAVDAHVVGEVVSGWTGIPVGKMVKDELTSVLTLAENLQTRVIGQSHSLTAIHRRIQTSRANLEDPQKPIGVFLFVGPSGVGKTETAVALADILYGGERNLITINMSEFQEAHTVSTLKGAPPGYVGYGEGGVLTEAVRKRPYSVVLLDEVEKAHPDVLELFFQVFDKGVMEDGEGRRVLFRNTILLLTTNAATDTIMKLCADPETTPSPKGLVEAIKPELNKIFKPAFLGRTVIVPYYPLRDEALQAIVKLKLDKIVRRTAENTGVRLSYDERLIRVVVDRCTEVESGARNVDNILTNTVLPEISRELLTRMANQETVAEIAIFVGDDGEIVYR
jgi:type VI secretion system protein VasG